MTCHHCQTWNLDEEHRCRRCGRRVKATPSRISPETYPIAATATAPAYDYSSEPFAEPAQTPAAQPAQQQALFTQPVSDNRVIPFDSLRNPGERESMRARAADVVRPAPLKSEKVEIRHARPKKKSADQRRLDFQGQREVFSQPQSHIICDAPVAPPALRTEAALLDALLIVIGCAFGAAIFRFIGGSIPMDRHILPFAIGAFLTIPFFYKLLWTFAGQDTIGMKMAGLRLVDFDGNPPSHARRYHRLFGGFLSLLAAGIGMVWALMDEDSLTWHDHISSTFPTIASEA